MPDKQNSSFLLPSAQKVLQFGFVSFAEDENQPKFLFLGEIRDTCPANAFIVQHEFRFLVFLLHTVVILVFKYATTHPDNKLKNANYGGGTKG